MNNNEIYESPEIEKVFFENSDIVTASFGTEDDELPPTPWN